MSQASYSYPQVRSASSYHDEIWQVSWGENDITAAIREEMSRAVAWQKMHEPSPIRSSDTASSYKVPGFKPEAAVITQLPGMQQLVPAMILCAEKKTTVQQVDEAEADEAVNASISEVTRETFDGELPSVGSEAHFDGTCKRCCFFPKGRCQNGKDCTHCHFSHELRPRQRKRVPRTRGSAERDALDNQEANAIELDINHTPRSSIRSSTNRVSVSSVKEEEPGKTLAADDKSRKAALVALNSAVRFAAEYNREVNDQLREQSEAVASKMADADAANSVSTNSDGEEQGSSAAFASEDASYASDSSDSEVAAAPRHSLKKSPTSWSATVSNRGISRAARSLLNKLTETRFETICDQVLALPISTTVDLAALVSEIFQKATSENCFRSLYIDLCVRLDAHFAQQSGVIGGSAFKKALINECQATFERNLKPEDAAVFAGLTQEECFEAEMKLKTRRLGNMGFIADLFVRRLLAAKLLAPIVLQLLSRDEAALESLIALLKIVAPEFDKAESLHQALFQDAFVQLRKKITQKSVCSRIQCHIKDLLEAKEKGWSFLHIVA